MMFSLNNSVKFDVFDFVAISCHLETIAKSFFLHDDDDDDDDHGHDDHDDDGDDLTG